MTSRTIRTRAMDQPENKPEEPRIIRLPPTTGKRKGAYVAASRAKGQKLTAWIFDALDASARAAGFEPEDKQP